MPLSDEELKILREIEAQLNATDPELVDTVANSTVTRAALGAIRWAIFGFVGGLAIIVLTFTEHLVFAFGGFLLMLASLWTIAGNLKKIGKASLYNVFGIREGGVRRLVSDTREGIRDRFDRGE